MNALSSLARAPHTGTTLGELTLSIAHSFSHANTHPPPPPPLLHTAQVNADAMAYPVSTCYSAAPCGFNAPCGAPCTAPVLTPARPSCRLSPSSASRTSRSLPLGSFTLVLLTALACRVQGLGFSSVLAHMLAFQAPASSAAMGSYTTCAADGSSCATYPWPQV